MSADGEYDRGRSDRATLVLVFRRPLPGAGKQRIAAERGADYACALSRLLLDCALEDLAGWPGPVALSPANPADSAWSRVLAGRPAEVVPQPPGNLGVRILALDAELRRRGMRRALYIGSDAPALDGSYYEAAERALEETDVVLGPAADGGVTLMGNAAPWPAALAGLPWSEDGLGEALGDACRSAGLTVATLPGASDVDTVEDLARLPETLAGDERPARRALRRWIAGGDRQAARNG